MARGITFNGNNLQTANIIVSDIDDGSLPERQVNIFALAHANASKVTYDGWPTKTITLQGTLYSDTIANLDLLIDTFKGYTLGSEKNLDVDYAGTTRRYIATVNSMTLARPGGLTYGNFTLQFICSSPFGSNITSSSLLSASGRTSGAYSDTVTVVGTAPWQQPIYTITYTALTGGTAKTVNVGNAANGQQITITRTWVTGVILVIDTVAKTVTVNGTLWDYSGAFPELAPGSQTVAYSDSLTTRTFTISVVHNRMYL